MPPQSPAVFLGLSQDELDRAYDQDHWVANAAEIQARIIAHSHEVARAMPPQTRRYGLAEQQSIDIFAPKNAQRAPVFILIHGGGWRLSMREAFYGSAPSILAAGCLLAVAGFECLPAVSMVEMAGQVRQTVRWLAAEIAAFGGDPSNLHLVGHSSGAHLAAATLTQDPATPMPTIRSATLISGLYDLAPVMLSSRRHYISLTLEDAVALSPIHRASDFACAGSVWWGEHDSPEFKRQSQVFAEALRNTSKHGPSGMLTARNHFEMLEELDDPDSLVVKGMIAAAFGGVAI